MVGQATKRVETRHMCRGPLGRDLFVVEAKETTRLLALTKDTKRRSVVDQVSLG